MPQGTVKAYNAQSRSGLILDDANHEIPFDQEAFKTTGIREFRIGQRVRFKLEGDEHRPKVRDLTIVSF